jgi:hypothetical protein
MIGRRALALSGAAGLCPKPDVEDSQRRGNFPPLAGREVDTKARVIIRTAAVSAVFLATLPFILLTGMGWMKPAEGFCLETGFVDQGHPPSPEEAARSYFVSPELGYRYMAMTEHINWPICIRSRRGLHRFWALGRDHDLSLLHEPNLSHLHRTETGARAFRVLTHASFSPLPIAFRVEMNRTSGGVIHATWLDADAQPKPHVDPGQVQASWEVREEWLDALPPQRLTRRLSDADARALWSLLDAATPRKSVHEPALDGNWLVIEVIEHGDRKVRFVMLHSRPHPTRSLICALAAHSEIPSRALEQGHVQGTCDQPART